MSILWERAFFNVGLGGGETGALPTGVLTGKEPGLKNG